MSYPHNRQTGFLLSAETEKTFSLSSLSSLCQDLKPTPLHKALVCHLHTYTLTHAHVHPHTQHTHTLCCMRSRTYVPSFSLAGVNNQKLYIATRNHDTVTTTAYAEPEKQRVGSGWVWMGVRTGRVVLGACPLTDDVAALCMMVAV